MSAVSGEQLQDLVSALQDPWPEQTIPAEISEMHPYGVQLLIVFVSTPQSCRNRSFPQSDCSDICTCVEPGHRSVGQSIQMD